MQMKKQPQQSITSLPPSPDQERRSRVVKYSVAMGVRLVCFMLCFVVQGWWLVALLVAAIVLPYIAVVLANTIAPDERTVVARPGSIVRYAQPTPPGDGE
ncbi:Protein of unknown function (DUF3099) [Glaciihabitans tibetensis]|uniref:DUF3099 family protein n=2 Tax=Glaciihabitans tibetensis TaxID=1266600 RepID=A0A2T0VJQ0_9MICO|nr:Protein of unknown function (DUF3099) [Glaciihabitans tibetensis]